MIIGANAAALLLKRYRLTAARAGSFIDPYGDHLVNLLIPVEARDELKAHATRLPGKPRQSILEVCWVYWILLAEDPPFLVRMSTSAAAVSVPIFGWNVQQGGAEAKRRLKFYPLTQKTRAVNIPQRGG